MKKALHTILILIFIGQSLMVSADVDVPLMETGHHLNELTYSSLDSLSDDECGHCCNAHALNYVAMNISNGLLEMLVSHDSLIYKDIYSNPQESPFIRPPIV